MLTDWLSQGIVSNVLSAILIAIASVVGGIVASRAVAYYGRMSNQQVTTVAFGFLCFLMLLAIGFNVRTSFLLGKLVENKITTENAPVVVREWLDAVHLTVQQKDVDEAIFWVTVTTSGGRHIDLFQPKKLPYYLIIQTSAGPDASVAALLKTVSRKEYDSVLRLLHGQLASLGVKFNQANPWYGGIQLTIEIPITANLTQDELIKQLSQFDQAVMLTMEAYSAFEK